MKALAEAAGMPADRAAAVEAEAIERFDLRDPNLDQLKERVAERLEALFDALDRRADC